MSLCTVELGMLCKYEGAVICGIVQVIVSSVNVNVNPVLLVHLCSRPPPLNVILETFFFRMRAPIWAVVLSGWGVGFSDTRFRGRLRGVG